MIFIVHTFRYTVNWRWYDECGTAFTVGEKLVKRCGSRDPFEIARQLGINVMLCENFGSLKGMYRVIKRNRFIFLNNSLDENMLRIVCAHELGHDQLHRNMAKTTPIHEFMLYDMKSKPEYEATS